MRSAWTPVGVLGWNAVIRGGGVQPDCASGRFGGHLLAAAGGEEVRGACARWPVLSGAVRGVRGDGCRGSSEPGKAAELPWEGIRSGSEDICPHGAAPAASGVEDKKKASCMNRRPFLGLLVRSVSDAGEFEGERPLNHDGSTV